MKAFLKIPAGLFTASTKDIRLYCAFMDLKAFNPEGHICLPWKRREDRFYYSYWSKNLIAKRWAFEKDNCIDLVSYQKAWKDLGVEPGWDKKLKMYRFPYKKIEIDRLPLKRKEYFKALQDIVQKHIAGNKVRQIKWRLKTKQSSNNTETFMSTRTVARLFGLKSSASGHKYRKKVFHVIPEPTEKVSTEFGYRYKCKKIALQTKH